MRIRKDRMNKLKMLLTSEPYVLLDGAMGTMLMELGLESGAPPEEWNEAHPDRIQAVHQRYIEAGSQIILTNSLTNFDLGHWLFPYEFGCILKQDLKNFQYSFMITVDVGKIISDIYFNILLCDIFLNQFNSFIHQNTQRNFVEHMVDSTNAH